MRRGGRCSTARWSMPHGKPAPPCGMATRLFGLTRRSDGRVCGATVLDADGNTSRSRPIWWSVRMASVQVLRGSRSAETVLEGAPRHGADLRLFPRHRADRLSLVVSAGRRRRRHSDQSRPALRVRRDTARSVYGMALACTIAVPRSSRPCARQIRHWRLRCRRRPDEPLCVFAGRKGFLRQAFGPGWALVGDAGYFKDPLTAHGITDALRDAELLANAAAGGATAALRGLRRDTRRSVVAAVRGQ